MGTALAKLGALEGAKLILDAGDGASYTSGQKWLDLSGNGYDFFLGADGAATATDPTFNGTADRKSSGEYFSFDGGDYLTYDTTNETWMQNVHKNNAKLTIALWAYHVDTGVTSYCGTRGDTTGTGFIYARLSGVGVQAFRCFNAGVDCLTIDGTSTTQLPLNQWGMTAISIDEAAGTGSFFMNGVQETFTSTYVGPSAGNASFTFQVGARGNANSPVSSGTRIGSFMMWEGQTLTLGQLQAIYATTRGKFGV